jgi:hypothetical protein
LIGRVCKHSNVFSLPVLIGRAAWPQNNSHNQTFRGDVYRQIDFVISRLAVFRWR